MADSRIPGPLNPSNQLGIIPSRTPGPLGYLDQGDPNVRALLGDTPGSLGQNDGAAKHTNNSSVPLAMAAASTKRLTSPWKISKNLLEFLGTWENGRANGKNFAHQVVTDGFILTVYEDSKKLPTVGCGHLVVAADNLKLGDKISRERAVLLLTQDLAVAEQRINSIVVVPLHQYEYDALVSVAFNCGRNGVKILADFVGAGDYHAVPAFIETYRLGGGNKRRRKSEAKLFKSGKYDASH